MVEKRNSSWFVKGQSYEDHFGKDAERIRELHRISAKESYYPNKFKNLGRTHSEATKKKIGIANKGNVCSETQKKQISLANKGRKHSKATKKKISKAMEKLMESTDFRRRCLRRRKMSSLEVKFDGIVKELGLPYKFVGNGAFFIERKNPDFINTNGKKIAVEVYYKKHKDLFAGGLENWKRKRLEVFSEYGWEIKFFDAMEVNEENIFKNLGGDFYRRN